MCLVTIQGYFNPPQKSGNHLLATLFVQKKPRCVKDALPEILPDRQPEETFVPESLLDTPDKRTCALGTPPPAQVSQVVDDEVPPSPKPTKMPGEELSQGAIYKRMNRIFTARADGTYVVDGEFVKKWKNLESRRELNVLFEKCDYDPDTSLL